MVDVVWSYIVIQLEPFNIFVWEVVKFLDREPQRVIRCN